MQCKRSVFSMSSDIFYKNGKEIRSSFLKTEINTQDVENGLLSISLKPEDDEVLILRKNYDINTWAVRNVISLDSFILNCVYDEIHDSIEFNIHSSFDLFIFNICALLGIGTLKVNDKYVEFDEHGFAQIFQRVSVFYLTLEEFKMLDGFVGRFTLHGSSISFDGLLLNYKRIHESVSDGAHIPDLKSKLLERGEFLFEWD